MNYLNLLLKRAEFTVLVKETIVAFLTEVTQNIYHERKTDVEISTLDAEL